MGRPVNGPDTHQGNLSLSGSEVEEEILFGRGLGMARTPNKTTFPIMAATPCPSPRGALRQTYGHYYLQHRNYIKVITRSAARKTMELRVDGARGTTAATRHSPTSPAEAHRGGQASRCIAISSQQRGDEPR